MTFALSESTDIYKDAAFMYTFLIHGLERQITERVFPKCLLVFTRMTSYLWVQSCFYGTAVTTSVTVETTIEDSTQI